MSSIDLHIGTLRLMIKVNGTRNIHNNVAVKEPLSVDYVINGRGKLTSSWYFPKYIKLLSFPLQSLDLARQLLLSVTQNNFPSISSITINNNYILGLRKRF